MCCCKVGSVRSGVIWRGGYGGVRRGAVKYGELWYGGHDMVRYGSVCLGAMRSGKAVSVSCVEAGHSVARQGGLGWARHGRYGVVRCGSARHGGSGESGHVSIGYG